MLYIAERSKRYGNSNRITHLRICFLNLAQLGPRTAL